MLISDGLRYKDAEAGADGVSKVQIRESPTRAEAQLNGKGENRAAITLPAAAPLVAQLVNGETRLCWQATFEAGDVKKNVAGELRAISAP